ncbi:hypothetical protein Mpet_2501 [Methanolacinia petrolearia DSM 11571]|uniref:Uncharacterized protein n=2 Tax=Methanolacinia TaxID=230355 RepID=E1RF01_METP4|nr:hypothetical protein Mpet_2501 [Methanolacinia petrolearia DSM 11571]
MLSIAVIFFLLAIPAGAEEYPTIETGYTYIDGDSCDVFTYPSVDKLSHMGLSNGEVAYSKDKDPLIYIWDNRTGETNTFDTTVIAEKKDTWISFWMEIKCLDISKGAVYYSLSTHKTTPTGTSASSKGLFSFDGANNENIVSQHFIYELLADNSLVLVKDFSYFDGEPHIENMRLRVYSHDSGDIITIDNRTEINDPMGFGEYKVAVLSLSSISETVGDRVQNDGIVVFDIEPALAGGEVKEIVIPDATEISSDEKVNVNQDCFSDRYFVWSKGVKTSDGDNGQYQSTLYVTDLDTLENTAIDTNEHPDFGLYAYAVDGDYLIYKNDDGIFLYNIPDGEKKEIRITGNDEFEVGDIVEFDEGELLVRAYPKDYPGYEPSEYEIWFVDLNPFINPVEAEASETGAVETGSNEPGNPETPLSPSVSVFALVAVFVVFAVLQGKR